MKQLLTLYAILGLTSCAQKEKPVKLYTLFVGTYTDGDSDGIYKYSFNANSGNLENPFLAAPLNNPSFLVFSKDKIRLHAVQETENFDSLGGGVTTFSITNGKLDELKSIPSKGAHPCHVSISDSDEVAVSNYSGGNVLINKINFQGTLENNGQLIDHNLLDSTRTARAHMSYFMNDELFVSDLGLDALFRYKKVDNGYIPYSHQPAIPLPKGSGPRHFVFSKDNNYLYVINELNSTLTVFKNNAGVYELVQTVSTVDKNFKGESFCADVHISPDGKFLYGSNRGENSIVIFGIDKKNGSLNLIGREPVQGDWPRNFTFDPSGKFLLVANQKSNNICVFKRNREMGTLRYVSQVQLSSPVCLVFQE